MKYKRKLPKFVPCPIYSYNINYKKSQAPDIAGKVHNKDCAYGLEVVQQL